MSSDQPVTLAVIIGAHGIKGEVRLKLFAQDVESLKRYKAFNDGALALRNVREGPNGAIARFDGLENRTQVEALRGTPLTVPRSALPTLEEDEYYHTDLLAKICISTTGETLGQCVAVENFGAGDVLEIERPDGKTFMVPMTTQAVPHCSEVITINAAFVI